MRSKTRLHRIYMDMQSYQTCRLQTRRGCIYSFHSRYSLVVVDKPLRSNRKLWCIRNQILLPCKDTTDLFEHLISTPKHFIFIVQKRHFGDFWRHLSDRQQCILDAGQRTYAIKAILTHLLWSETTSGLLGSRNIFGKDRTAPDGSPTKQRHNKQ